MAKVVACQDIAQGSFSYDISVDTLFNNTNTPKVLRVKQNPQGRITSAEDDSLVQNIKWSDDVHECNTLLERGSLQCSIRIIITKNIVKGEELVLWFSQDILAAMDIPFLNPINILGEKNYTCHRCGQIFEYPNPLKIHLGLNCGILKVRELWKRLRNSLCLASYGQKIHHTEFRFTLSLKKRKPVAQIYEKAESYGPPSPVLSSYSTPSPVRGETQIEDIRPSSEPPRDSAFKPYFNSREYNPEKRLSDFSIPYLTKEHILNQQAAEIETLVSNLGQSKQGHLCLYCGKIYSRKYGLKIHIRTHTGFKPLKCKYCHRPFGDPSNLNKHVRLHSETDTPYRCRLCGKMLVRRRDLERHLKSRHDVEDN